MCALGRTSKENICFATSRVRSNGSQISCVSIRVWLNDSEPWTRFSRICVYPVAQVNRSTSPTCHYRPIDSCVSYSGRGMCAKLCRRKAALWSMNIKSFVIDQIGIFERQKAEERFRKYSTMIKYQLANLIYFIVFFLKKFIKFLIQIVIKCYCIWSKMFIFDRCEYNFQILIRRIFILFTFLHRYTFME